MPDDFAKSELPAVLREIDISGFAGLGPRDLILNPDRLVADTLAAGRAIVYARSGDQATYDAIGFRTFAASPRRGPSPLQTSAWTAMHRDPTDRQKDATLAEILNQQPKLRHRPLVFPGENYRYAIDRHVIHLYRRKTAPAGREVEDRWTFSLTDPPEFLSWGALDRDEPMIAAQRLQVDLQGTHWLPFSVLLADGCFRRLQDVRSLLVRKTRPGSFYGFLSHRWLGPSHPDPDALQAQFAAWQLIAYLAEAVRVADDQGADTRQDARRRGTQCGAF
jgi:hypothetical protein